MLKISRRALRFYFIGIALIALMTTAGHMLITRVVGDQQAYASVINLSGRQRMLSQRIALNAQGLLLTNMQRDYDALSQSLDEFESAHTALMTGSPHPRLTWNAPVNASTEVIYRGETNLDEQVQTYIRQGRMMLTDETRTQSVADALRDQSAGELINGLELAVREYQREAEIASDRAIQIGTVLWVATLIMLIIEWVFIFKPQNDRLYRLIRMLVKQKRRIGRARERFLLAATSVRFGIWDRPDTSETRIVFTESFLRAMSIRNASDIKQCCDGFLDLVHPDHKEDTRNRLFSDAAYREKDATMVHLLRIAPDEYRWFQTKLRNLDYDKNGIPRRQVAFVLDIHRQKLAEQIKSEFVSTMNHELRTPLTSIKGSLQLLSSGKLMELNPSAGHLVGMAMTNTERLSALVEGILDLERLDAGRMPASPETLPLKEVLGQCVENAEGYASAHGIEIVRGCCTGAEALIHVDPAHLARVMDNLLSNAIKFSGDSKQITVSCKANEDHVSFSVADQGIGIDPDFRQRMFDRFTQFDGSSTRSHQGSGLGLAIVRELVTLMNGEVSCTSVLSEGSSFTVTLPRAHTVTNTQMIDLPSQITAA
ncbi:ATP-binding protein [Ponticaulis koreensis]|uniref:ATP-binding protein n=1 Tax=Ponticaulis koreensis TaxID=1123045 RepID=UPI0003B472B9|nr:ATP-binding protein [Ponticaulis koreensis]